MSALRRGVIKATIVGIGTRVLGHFCGETKEHLQEAQIKLGISNWEEEFQVRGILLCVFMFYNYFCVILYD